jgi:hypothetical protein
LGRFRERAGQGDLDRTVGVSAQEFDIANLDRPQPADRTDDLRHDDGATGAPAPVAGLSRSTPESDVAKRFE